MTYIPISPNERDAMLETIGVKSLDDLFEAIPAKHRFPKLNLPAALTEMEAMDELSGLANANENVRSDLVSFLGAGMYNHYIPSAVDHMLRRGEFYTAYTPYQPEISQGTLQAIFEYQSLMTHLTGMEVSNARDRHSRSGQSRVRTIPRQTQEGDRLPHFASALSGGHPHVYAGHGTRSCGR